MGLQFTWIELNLLDFFLVDVRRSRGKFDEIRQKFMMNPAPIGSQSSLNVGGSWGTHDLSFKLLNSFTIESRVKFFIEKKVVHQFLREISARFSGHLIQLRGLIDGHDYTMIVSHQYAAIMATIMWWLGHDRGSIKPRSHGDRAVIVWKFFAKKSQPSDLVEVGWMVVIPHVR